MGFKDKLKELGYITPDAEAPAKSKKVNGAVAEDVVPSTPAVRRYQPIGKATTNTTPKSRASAPVATPTAMADPGYVADLESAIAACQTPGYDQFVTILQVMNTVPDEAQRYQLTLQTVQAGHKITPKQVLQSIDDRLDILASEENEFNEAMAEATTDSVGTKHDEVQAIVQEITRKQDEIRELQERQASLANEIQASESNINRSKAAFAAAFALVKQRLTDARTRIANYIPTEG